MNNKVKAFAILPIAASLVFFGLQTVTSSVAATEGVGETPATTGATAATLEDCEWYLDGVDTELSLTNTSGLEYVGDDYELTAEDSGVNVYFSGTVAQDERCSFYDDVRGAGVEVSWTGDSFNAGDDESLDWNLGDNLETSGISTLDVTYSKDTCDDAFTAGGAVSISDPLDSPLSPASISDADTGLFFPSSLLSPTFAKCTLDATYSVVLPGSRTPANPGGSYTFTGPALSTTITVNEAL